MWTKGLSAIPKALKSYLMLVSYEFPTNMCCIQRCKKPIVLRDCDESGKSAVVLQILCNTQLHKSNDKIGMHYI